MPTTLEETSKKSAVVESAVVESVFAESVTENAEPESKHDTKWYLDQDPTLYPEAVAHILTPKRRRTVVTTETFAAIRAACDKH